jgi:hypothetical protein
VVGAPVRRRGPEMAGTKSEVSASLSPGSRQPARDQPRGSGIPGAPVARAANRLPRCRPGQSRSTWNTRKSAELIRRATSPGVEAGAARRAPSAVGADLRCASPGGCHCPPLQSKALCPPFRPGASVCVVGVMGADRSLRPVARFAPAAGPAAVPRGTPERGPGAGDRRPSLPTDGRGVGPSPRRRRHPWQG